MIYFWAEYVETPPFYDGIIVNEGYVDNIELSLDSMVGNKVVKIHTMDPPSITYVNGNVIDKYILNGEYKSPFLVTEASELLVTEDGTPLIIG
jgi:hypothetical protein